MKPYDYSALKNSQQGAVLVVGLMLLLIMSLLALSGSTSALITSRLINNLNNQSMGLQTAQNIMAQIAADANCFTNAANQAIEQLNDNRVTTSTCNVGGNIANLTTITTTTHEDNSETEIVQINIQVDLNIIENGYAINITQGFNRNYRI